MFWDRRPRLKRCTLGTLAISMAMGATLPMGHSQDVTARNSEIPDWLARTDISIYADNNVIQGEFETIQPLFQSPDFSHTFFTQLHAEYGDEKFTLNGGLGYRYLLPSEKIILGVNGFFDMETEQYHKRVGMGFEAIGEQLTLRGNWYKGITGWNKLSSTATTRTDTKPVDGFDIALEGPMPYMPWLRAEATYFKWTPDLADDVDGFQGKLIAQLTDTLSAEAGYRHNGNDDFVFGRLTFALGRPKEHEFTASDEFFSSIPFKPRDLKKHTLDKVERNHEIVLEKRVVSTAGGVTTVASQGVTISAGS